VNFNKYETMGVDKEVGFYNMSSAMAYNSTARIFILFLFWCVILRSKLQHQKNVGFAT